MRYFKRGLGQHIDFKVEGCQAHNAAHLPCQDGKTLLIDGNLCRCNESLQQFELIAKDDGNGGGKSKGPGNGFIFGGLAVLVALLIILLTTKK